MLPAIAFAVLLGAIGTAFWSSLGVLHEVWGDNVFLETAVDTGIAQAWWAKPPKGERQQRGTRRRALWRS